MPPVKTKDKIISKEDSAKHSLVTRTTGTGSKTNLKLAVPEIPKIPVPSDVLKIINLYKWKRYKRELSFKIALHGVFDSIEHQKNLKDIKFGLIYFFSALGKFGMIKRVAPNFNYSKFESLIKKNGYNSAFSMIIQYYKSNKNLKLSNLQKIYIRHVESVLNAYGILHKNLHKKEIETMISAKKKNREEELNSIGGVDWSASLHGETLKISIHISKKTEEEFKKIKDIPTFFKRLELHIETYQKKTKKRIPPNIRSNLLNLLYNISFNHKDKTELPYMLNLSDIKEDSNSTLKTLVVGLLKNQIIFTKAADDYTEKGNLKDAISELKKEINKYISSGKKFDNTRLLIKNYLIELLELNDKSSSWARVKTVRDFISLYRTIFSYSDNKVNEPNEKVKGGVQKKATDEKITPKQLFILYNKTYLDAKQYFKLSGTGIRETYLYANVDTGLGVNTGLGGNNSNKLIGSGLFNLSGSAGSGIGSDWSSYLSKFGPTSKVPVNLYNGKLGLSFLFPYNGGSPSLGVTGSFNMPNLINSNLNLPFFNFSNGNFSEFSGASFDIFPLGSGVGANAINGSLVFSFNTAVGNIPLPISIVLEGGFIFPGVITGLFGIPKYIKLKDYTTSGLMSFVVGVDVFSAMASPFYSTIKSINYLIYFFTGKSVYDLNIKSNIGFYGSQKYFAETLYYLLGGEMDDALERLSALRRHTTSGAIKGMVLGYQDMLISKRVINTRANRFFETTRKTVAKRISAHIDILRNMLNRGIKSKNIEDFVENYIYLKDKLYGASPLYLQEKGELDELLDVFRRSTKAIGDMINNENEPENVKRALGELYIISLRQNSDFTKHTIRYKINTAYGSLLDNEKLKSISSGQKIEHINVAEYLHNGFKNMMEGFVGSPLMSNKNAYIYFNENVVALNYIFNRPPSSTIDETERLYKDTAGNKNVVANTFNNGTLSKATHYLLNLNPPDSPLYKKYKLKFLKWVGKYYPTLKSFNDGLSPLIEIRDNVKEKIKKAKNEIPNKFRKMSRDLNKFNLEYGTVKMNKADRKIIDGNGNELFSKAVKQFNEFRNNLINGNVGNLNEDSVNPLWDKLRECESKAEGNKELSYKFRKMRQFVEWFRPYYSIGKTFRERVNLIHKLVNGNEKRFWTIVRVGPEVFDVSDQITSTTVDKFSKILDEFNSLNSSMPGALKDIKDIDKSPKKMPIILKDLKDLNARFDNLNKELNKLSKDKSIQLSYKRGSINRIAGQYGGRFERVLKSNTISFSNFISRAKEDSDRDYNTRRLYTLWSRRKVRLFFDVLSPHVKKSNGLIKDITDANKEVGENEGRLKSMNKVINYLNDVKGEAYPQSLIKKKDATIKLLGSNLKEFKQVVDSGKESDAKLTKLITKIYGYIKKTDLDKNITVFKKVFGKQFNIKPKRKRDLIVFFTTYKPAKK